jgi:uncharacterized membrane protein YkvA (DUF1232 family)
VKVSFELSPRDMRYFRERLQEARDSETAADEDTVLRLAGELVEEARESEPPEFVLERLERLEQLVEILRDEEWKLEGRDRARVLDALIYFVDPDDLIPDRIPGLGYLDDAIMIELVVQELKHDIQAYEDFCGFRSGRKKVDPEVVEKRREDRQARMRRRTRNERQSRRRGGRSKRSPLRLW